MDRLSLTPSGTSDNLYSRAFPVTVGQQIGTNRGLLWSISDLSVVSPGMGVTAEVSMYRANGTTFTQQLKLSRNASNPAFGNIVILEYRVFSVITLPAGTTCAALA